jgi:hypothetical protein
MSSVGNHSVLFFIIENGEWRMAVDFPPLLYGKSLNKLVVFSERREEKPPSFSILNSQFSILNSQLPYT